MYNNIEQFIWLWRVFGLAPVTKQTHKKKSKFSHSLTIYLISIFGIILHTVMFFKTAVNTKIKNKFLIASFTQTTVSVLDILLLIFITNFYISLSFCSWRFFLTAIKQMKKTEFLFMRLKLKSSTYSFFITFGCLLWHVILSISSMSLLAYYGEPIAYFTYSYFLRIIPSLSALQFISIVLIIWDRFKFVNEVTAEVINYHILEKKHRNEISCVPQISTLNFLHEKLCEFSKKMSMAFGLQILSCIAFITLQVIFVLYRIITYSFYPKYGAVIGNIAINFLWALTLLVQLAIILWVCSSTKAEADQTLIIVLNNLTKKLPNPFYKQILEFEFRLRFRKCQFTAGGYFILNNSVFLVVCSAATTYIAVLMTFQLQTQSTANN